MSSIFSVLALLMSMLAFALGFAPFTPAMLLAFIAVPLALIAAVFGAWRMGIVTVYFSMAAWLVAPLSWNLPIRVDYLLVLLGLGGLLLGTVLLLSYCRARWARDSQSSAEGAFLDRQ